MARKKPSPKNKTNSKSVPGQVIFLGKKKIIDPDKPSVKKSTAQKAEFIRKFLDLPFRNSVNFSPAQKKLIDKKYDGVGGEVALRRYSGARRVKVNNPARYQDAGYLVTQKKYVYGGKKKIGNFVWIKPESKKSKLYAVKNGIVEKTGQRKTLRINIPRIGMDAFLDDPEKYTKGEADRNKKLFPGKKKKYYKLVFPAGEGRFEYQDLEDLEKYVEKMNDASKSRITGIAIVTHASKKKSPAKKGKKRVKRNT